LSAAKSRTAYEPGTTVHEFRLRSARAAEAARAVTPMTGKNYVFREINVLRRGVALMSSI
jgi:hypothetical protein